MTCSQTMSKSIKKTLLISILAFLLFIDCLIFFIVNPVFPTETEKNSAVVNIQRMKNDAETLIGDNTPRHHLDLDRLNTSATFIENSFRENDCAIEIQEFIIEGNTYKNIICSYNTNKTERIIMGAHYDTQVHTPGADDNTSGVVGLLELSRILQENTTSIDYRIDLIAYTLEEAYFGTQYMGSSIHAKSMYEQNIEINAMISLEMIGYYSDQPGSQKYPLSIFKAIYPSKGNYIAIIGNTNNLGLTRQVKRSFHRSANIDTWSMNAPAFIPGINFSDHFGYWEYGYPAIMVTDTSFYRNSNYHKETDTLDTLDFEKMGEVIKGVHAFILER